MSYHYNDKVLIKYWHENITDRIFKIYLAVADNIRHGRYIFTVGGPSGSGKTEVAILLRDKLLEHRCCPKSIDIISQDSFYKTNPDERDEDRRNGGVIGKEELNWPSIYNHVDNKKYQVTIFEGLYACYLKRKAFKIYLDGTEEDTYEFRKERGKENPDCGFRKHVLERERRSVEGSRRLAEMVIPIKEYMEV